MLAPAYMAYGPALHIPPFRRIAGRGKNGCNGDACEV